MTRHIMLVWVIIFATIAAWITYLSFTTIPAKPCERWDFLPPLDQPPGLGTPQLALFTLFAVLPATLHDFVRHTEKKIKLLFLLIFPIVYVCLALSGVVDLEIYGGCVKLGGPEFGRYNSFEALMVFMIVGAPIYILLAGITAGILCTSVHFARRAMSQFSA